MDHQYFCDVWVQRSMHILIGNLACHVAHFQLLYYKMTREPKNIYVQGMLNLGWVGGNRQKQVHP